MGVTRRKDEQDSRRKQQGAPQRVELQIDELVLHGFVPGDRYRIARALESELTRLIQERGVPSGIQHSANLRSLDGRALNLAAGAHPDVIGRQVAREVYGRMGR